MFIQKFFTALGALLLAVFLLTGCGKNGAGGAGAKTFDNAAPEVKALWDKAVAADKANDYVTATVAYKEILRGQDQLQPGQVTLVENACGKLFQRLMDASGKGDPQARQAMATLGALDRQQSHH